MLKSPFSAFNQTQNAHLELGIEVDIKKISSGSTNHKFFLGGGGGGVIYVLHIALKLKKEKAQFFQASIHVYPFHP